MIYKISTKPGGFSGRIQEKLTMNGYSCENPEILSKRWIEIDTYNKTYKILASSNQFIDSMGKQINESEIDMIL